MSDLGTQQKQTRTQRRVLRTRATIEEAFVDLVLEKGYDKVSVEDITNKADVARATFYAHYTNKEALLSAVFSRLIEGLGERVSFPDRPWSEVRTSTIEAAYKHAGELRDLYKACLSDSWARQAYLSTITRYMEQIYRERLEILDRKPLIPVAVMARGFAGAHVAILESWLSGEVVCSVEELATMEVDLLMGGSAWALGLDPAELGYTTESGPGNGDAGSSYP
jgi:AcrR family transcriptional regulator